MTHLGAVAVNPAEGVVEIGDDRGQFDLRRQAIVERHEGVALALAKVQELFRHRPAIAGDQRIAMNPHDHRPDLRVVGAVHVGLDGEVAGGLVRVGFLGERRRSSHQNRSGQKDDRGG